MTSSVHSRLYERYFKEGGAHVPGASSHWREFARHFGVRPNGEENFELTGYGFGASSSASVASRACSYVANAIHMNYLDAPGLGSDVRWAAPIVRRMGLYLSQDAFRQVCTVNLVTRYLRFAEPPRLIVVIGDGHGVLSGLLHARFPDARICLIDLGAVLFFQSYHLRKAFPEVIQSIADEALADCEKASFHFCPAESVRRLPLERVDLALNVASMQEMDPSAIADYFSLLRNRGTHLFYCCNRIEKHLPEGEVTRFMDYPWSSDDQHLVDEPCPWHQWFLGRAPSPQVRVWGVPIPLMHRYAGAHWHRLTRLATK